MPDNIPGFNAMKESEEFQITGRGPDNYGARFHRKVHIKSTVTDSGNTGYTTTLRGGFVLAIKDSDGFAYAYDADANDGTQNPIGVLEQAVFMLLDGTATDRFSKVLGGGLLKDTANDLIGEDKAVMAVLLRSGFQQMNEPHGSSFLLHPRKRYFDTADYTILDADHGSMRVAITNAVNYTLPSLATVGRGFSILLYNAVDASMVITGAANTIIYGDAGGALSTTLTFSTANKKMGGTALMYADYGTDGATLQWYVLTGGTVPVSA